MAKKLFDLARMTTATVGTGTLTLGSAVTGFLSFAGAGAANGDVVWYGIRDGANSEVGYGTYTSAGTTLSRNVIKSTNSNSAISLSGTAEVFITGLAEAFDIDELQIHGADIASASTVNLDNATGDLVDITGTTTITALTLAEGNERTVRFTGALLLTHGSSLVLPGAGSITTAAGDFAIFRGYAAGVVRCVVYVPASGQPFTTALATIASASTTDLQGTIGHGVTISGTTTITSFGSAAPTGAVKFVYFSGALKLTHNGTSLILPGAIDITTAAGDCLIARHEGSGNWRVLHYLHAMADVGIQTPINTQTASYTVVMADAGKTIEMNVGSANTLTIPPNSTTAFPIGTFINWTQIGAGKTTLTAGAGVTIRNRNGLGSGGQYAGGTLYKRGTDEWLALGDLGA